jgi:hypothetical protein
MCAPGSIRERYELCFRPGKLDDVSMDCSVADLISGNKINYPALVNYVSAPCAACPDDPCIALANVQVPAKGTPLEQQNIDIAVRYLVFGLDLLHDLMMCLSSKSTAQDHTHGGKS